MPRIGGAAARFGVSAASVTHWLALRRDQEDVRPSPLGGDRRSERIEAVAALVLGLLEEKHDATTEEVRHALGTRGHRFGYTTLHRFFQRHRITRKKGPVTLRNRSARTS